MVKIRRKGAYERRNAPGSREENFVAWVSGEYDDFEEKELEERMMGLLNRYATHKRKQQLSSRNESDVAPAQTRGSSQPAVEGGWEMQAIIIPGSSESGPTDQTEPMSVSRIESKEADPVSSALQVIPSPDRAEGQPSRSKFMPSRMPRPTLPDRIITDCYAPSRGPEPLRVEVSAPGADEVKHVMRRWEPFHR